MPSAGGGGSATIAHQANHGHLTPRSPASPQLHHKRHHQQQHRPQLSKPKRQRGESTTAVAGAEEDGNRREKETRGARGEKSRRRLAAFLAERTCPSAPGTGDGRRQGTVPSIKSPKSAGSGLVEVGGGRGHRVPDASGGGSLGLGTSSAESARCGPNEESRLLLYNNFAAKPLRDIQSLSYRSTAIDFRRCSFSHAGVSLRQSPVTLRFARYPVLHPIFPSVSPNIRPPEKCSVVTRDDVC